MTSNSHTNNQIKGIVVVLDFLLLNALLLLYSHFSPLMEGWLPTKTRIFFITINVALLIGQYYRSTIIHQRNIAVEDIVKRVLGLVIITIVLAYLMMKGISLSNTKVGMQLITFGIGWTICLFISRYVERQVVKAYRKKGGNTRRATFVGSDPELLEVYSRLNDVATKGYRIIGYYADEEMNDMPEGVNIKKLGTIRDLFGKIKQGQTIDEFGDEIYVCLSRLQRDVIREISRYCDQKLVRFYYVPVSVETLGIDLKRELLDDIEIFTTYENPLLNPVNKAVKRLFDIVLSIVFLIPTALIFPFVWIIMKIQSPGPVFFKQLRTGLDGKDFEMLKFRSMHVNADADKVQATKDDPRKYPFGNFMRKSNIDELPQFLNVLKGDMSIVGPRPHMLAHTEQYSQLIDKYMVRHFVKPGVTGWAQVTGFRGETSELWQMEGRVKRDIWYMEHWSIWLDIRIIWMTIKTIFVHDRNAY